MNEVQVMAVCQALIAMLLWVAYEVRTRHHGSEIEAYQKKYDALAKAYKVMERQRTAWMLKYCNLVGLDADEVAL